MKRTSWSSGLSVTADGVGVISHAGAIAPRLLADRVGLAAELSKAMVRRRFVAIYDRGRVLTHVAVMLTSGGETISDIGVLRHQSGALGPVASAPTVWRTLDEVTAGKRKKIQVARARTRRHVWSHLPGGVPASTCAGRRDLGSTIVLDVDATLVVTHSEKENTAATYKRTFGDHRNRRVVRQHRRVPGGEPSPGQCRLRHCLRPHRRPWPGDRADPRRSPA
ncbi:transposase [Dietzia aurantiaca]|uniref:Transposase n=1 Tax=Dietzia aurantiaca TaxID=983873 RepID=A0ABV9PMB5_9ACTN